MPEAILLKDVETLGEQGKVVDGLQVEGTFRAHQVPLSDPRAIWKQRTSMRAER